MRLKFIGLMSLLGLPLMLSAEPFHLESDQEKRVDAILQKLSLQEKIGQLTQNGFLNEAGEAAAAKGMVGSFLNVVGAEKVNALQARALKAKAKIPLIIGLDVIHGYRTIFPIPLAESCSWDPDLAERNAAAAAIEAHAAGVRWTFAPMMDIARDPRWGRIMEGAGEDPSLGAEFAAARVRGFQKDHLLVACAKHFAGYGAAEAGKDYNAVTIAPRGMWETYYPPFEGALDAGVGTFMSSFNTINGVPLASDPEGLRGVLKKAWGFGGFVVSDWGSIAELIDHGVAYDQADAARQGVLAGVDMDMASQSYLRHLEGLLKSGAVSNELVDDAVRRVLRVKMWLGLFDDAKTDPALEAKVTLSPAMRAQALEAASRSCVLLKNDGVLPFKADIKRLAVIGPLADSQKDPLGNWSAKGSEKDVVSVLQGLRNRQGDEDGMGVDFAPGCDVRGSDRSGFDKALEIAKTADAVILVMGEDCDMSGEAYSRSDIGLPGIQHELVMAVVALGRPTVLVLMNGRPMTFEWEAEHVPAILEAWFPGVETGAAVTGLLFGDQEPQGRLTVTFPRSVGQIPIYHSVLPTARPMSDKKWTSKYIDSPNTPRYPFGYGLSYAKFAYSDLTAPAFVEPGQDVVVRVKVSNIGARSGVETAQLYLHDKVATVSRPGRELKGYAKFELKKGETRELSFILTPAELAYYHRDLSFGWEPGDFVAFVGSDASAPLAVSFTVKGKADMIALPGQKPGLAKALIVSADMKTIKPRAIQLEAPKLNLAPADDKAQPEVTGPVK